MWFWYLFSIKSNIISLKNNKNLSEDYFLRKKQECNEKDRVSYAQQYKYLNGKYFDEIWHNRKKCLNLLVNGYCKIKTTISTRFVFRRS
jgi:hypothetical protein